MEKALVKSIVLQPVPQGSDIKVNATPELVAGPWDGNGLMPS